MSRKGDTRWLMQLVKAYQRGIDARKEGLPRTVCPYMGGYRNNQGAGGGLQRQRRDEWYKGYDKGENP